MIAADLRSYGVGRGGERGDVGSDGLLGADTRVGALIEAVNLNPLDD